MQSFNNIIIFSNTLKKGGAEKQAIELANILQDRYSVMLIIFWGDQFDAEMLKMVDDYHVKSIFLNEGSILKKSIAFCRIIKSNQTDCIISYLATTNILNSLCGTLCKVKYRIGGFRNSSYRGLKLAVQKYLHNHFLTISIANSYCGKKFLAKAGLAEDRIKVIHNVFIPHQSRIKATKSEIPIIISVARFVSQKDYRTALSSIAIIKNKHPQLKFIYRIIGYGKLEEEIRTLVKELALSDCVDIVINPNNVQSFLSGSDIYLSTSLYEGTSNSILEAMYAELPVVATNVGDNMYMVTNENGFLTNVKDTEDIAEKLTILLENKETRTAFGKKSKEIVLSQFGIESFKKNYFSLLDTLLYE